MMGEEEIDMMANEPIGAISFARGMKLARVEVEAAFVVVGGELEVGGVEADNANSSAIFGDGGREVPREKTWVVAYFNALGRGVGALPFGEPLGVGLEGFVNEGAVFARRIAEEFGLEVAFVVESSESTDNSGDVGADEVVVARDGEEDRAGAEALEMGEEAIEELVEAVELVGGSGLDEVACEEDEVEGASDFAEAGEVVEKLLADGRQEVILVVHAAV